MNIDSMPTIKRKTTLFLVVLLGFTVLNYESVRAQSAGVSINTDNSPPHASAMFDVTSTSQGMLVPRMTTTQRLAILTPANSLLVYDITESTYYYYNTGSATWKTIGLPLTGTGTGSPVTGTVKFSVTDVLAGETNAAMIQFNKYNQNDITLTTDNGAYSKAALYVGDDGVELYGGLGVPAGIWAENQRIFCAQGNATTAITFPIIGNPVGVVINSSQCQFGAGVKNSVILGGVNIAATLSNFVYVPNLAVTEKAYFGSGTIVSELNLNGPLKLTHAGSGIEFADGSVQTAAVRFTSPNQPVFDNMDVSNVLKIGTGTMYLGDPSGGTLGTVNHIWTDNTAPLVIQPDLSTAGYTTQNNTLINPSGGRVGIGTANPASKLHVKGATGYGQFTLETTYTPTGKDDPNGNVGDITWGSEGSKYYIYVKTPDGWHRSKLNKLGGDNDDDDDDDDDD